MSEKKLKIINSILQVTCVLCAFVLPFFLFPELGIRFEACKTEEQCHDLSNDLRNMLDISAIGFLYLLNCGYFMSIYGINQHFSAKNEPLPACFITGSCMGISLLIVSISIYLLDEFFTANTLIRGSSILFVVFIVFMSVSWIYKIIEIFSAIKRKLFNEQPE